MARALLLLFDADELVALTAPAIAIEDALLALS